MCVIVKDHTHPTIPEDTSTSSSENDVEDGLSEMRNPRKKRKKKKTNTSFDSRLFANFDMDTDVEKYTRKLLTRMKSQTESSADGTLLQSTMRTGTDSSQPVACTPAQASSSRTVAQASSSSSLSSASSSSSAAAVAAAAAPASAAAATSSSSAADAAQPHLEANSVAPTQVLVSASSASGRVVANTALPSSFRPPSLAPSAGSQPSMNPSPQTSTHGAQLAVQPVNSSFRNVLERMLGVPQSK